VPRADARRCFLCRAAQLPLAEFRELLAAQAALPAAQQRLIFRGRVLSDAAPSGEPLTLEALGIEDGHTLHLVTRAPPLPGAPPAPRNGARSRSLARF
jgi:hypothetical protein